MSNLVQPSIATLPGQVWVPIPIEQSTIAKPVSRLSGASVNIPNGEILYWNGDGPPSDTLAAIRSTGPGVCYLGVPERDQFDASSLRTVPGVGQVRGQVWWLFYDSLNSTDILDIQLIPLPSDSEFAVYAMGLPGWTRRETQSVQLVTTSPSTVIRGNPDRKYIAFCNNSTGSSQRIYLAFGGTNPTVPDIVTPNGVGIPLQFQGSIYEMWGPSLYRGDVRAVSNVATAILSIIEGI